jgi:multidrug efflux system membrane fusion protein
MKSISIFTLAAIVLASQLLSGCGAKNSNAETAKHATLVKIAAVERQNLSEPIRASGVLVGKEESRLSFKIGGIIEKIYVKEGQLVQQGQRLATLKLSEINAQVSQAQQAKEKAERDLSRVKNLYEDKVATLEQLQDATTGFEVAQSALTIAQFNQRYATIYAPASGKVLKKFAEENELVGAGMPILQLSNAAQGFAVKVGIAGRDAVRLNVGDRATVKLDAFPNQSFAARVSQISGAASMQTGTFDVELKVDESTARLISGLIATTEIFPSTSTMMTLVPIEAFIEGDGNNGFIFSLSPDSQYALKRPVEVGFIYHNKLALPSALADVQSVITDGVAYLIDSSRVQVKSDK